MFDQVIGAPSVYEIAHRGLSRRRIHRYKGGNGL
jgi:hypothetical protein